jgi:DNA-binding LacI/PurR family transcriptional regulator
VVTIADVARHAGVAPSTVSYVLTGRRSISAATKERVHASVRLLGYRSSVPTRTPNGAAAGVLAMVLPLRDGMNMPVVTQIVIAVAGAARRHGQDVLLLTADEGAEGVRRVAESGRVDGLVVMDVEMHDERVPVLLELDPPAVLIGVPADATGLTCVDRDFAAAGARSVDHLADLGHRHLALLGAPRSVYRRDTGFAHRAMAGFSAAAMRRGVAVTTSPVEHDAPSVRRLVTDLFREHPALTALVVHNETSLPLVVDALRSLGLRIPEDVSVVALCPDDVAERVSPPLTSVDIPADELGHEAVALLRRKLDGEPVQALTLLPPRLTDRASAERRPVRG